MKEKVNLGRHFGFHWEAELDPEYGETLISAQEANTRGGWFMIIHTPDEDDFGLYEEGGRGPDIWDEEHGYFDTLLEAMREARRLYKAELEYLEEWERNNLPPPPDPDCAVCFGVPWRTLVPGVEECPGCGAFV